MRKYKIDVIDINSVLPLYTLIIQGDNLKQADSVDMPESEIIFEQKELNIEGAEDNTVWDHLPDENLGKLGEEYIEKKLLAQKEKNACCFEVERVSETRKKRSPGYDIEVIKEDLLIGIEVKAKWGCEINVIHLTNNELRAMLRLRENSYLIIVIFDKESNEVKELYRINNFIETFKIDALELEKIISSDTLNGIDFYPQVFVINLPKDILRTNKINIFANII